MEHGRFFCCPRFDSACTLGSLFDSMNADELHVILAAFLFYTKSTAGLIKETSEQRPEQQSQARLFLARFRWWDILLFEGLLGLLGGVWEQRQGV